MKGKAKSWKDITIMIALRKAYHHHLQFWKIFAIDLVMLLLLYNVSLKIGLLQSSNATVAGLIALVYFAFLFIIYNGAKYFIMLTVHKIVDNEEKRHNWRHLREFMLINLVTVIIVLFIMSILGSVLFYGLKANMRGMIGLVGYSVLFLCFYLFINVLHAVFFLSAHKKSSIIKAFQVWKSKFFSLCSVFLFDALLLSVFLLLFAGVGLAVKSLVLPMDPSKVNDLYNFLFILFFSFFLYITHYINRIFIFLKVKS